jgi:hypothetical protein
MTTTKLPNTIRAMTANDLGHRAEFAARTGRPLPIIQLADGRELPVRGARFSPRFTTLLYSAGPSDTYRHDYLLDVLPDEDPCANCGRDLTDHDRTERAACQSEHLAHMGVK